MHEVEFDLNLKQVELRSTQPLLPHNTIYMTHMPNTCAANVSHGNKI